MALAALSARKEEAEIHLQHLEKLNILQSAGSAGEYIRFTLDFLAEYLPGLYLINTYSNDEKLWLQFLEKLTANSKRVESILGFLKALQDCCQPQEFEVKIPDFLLTNLEQLSKVPQVENTNFTKTLVMAS